MVLSGEREPGVAGELPEEDTLRPPVALAERMQGVDLAQVMGLPPDEPHLYPRSGHSWKSARQLPTPGPDVPGSPAGLRS